MDNRRDVETGQVHCGKCNKQLDWNMERNAFTECSCVAKPPLEDQLDQLDVPTTISPFTKPVPTVPNMTLRDWFAGQALAGLASSSHPDRAATLAYQCADAMLKAREVMP